ncbi:hypothetical protein [Nitrosomonas sp.]|uniref:hypothetical protein n=1 Tax=Nitrosomonas sp. TaxID=42353 RepID=UPI0020806496|nr:hypothetical protein [Nitrosomonas sp.]GJL75097.1 MAG: hypothetical protein NMNS02_12030 [Nitrosomonas sp.]
MTLEDKVARICWNTNNWQRPSGRSGKATNPKAYESQTGYGHEEWLFDISKLVDGHHYAYIQAIGQHRDNYLGKVFNISFYTINGSTKERWWLGEIKNIHVISADESNKIYNTYKKNGWLQGMHTQLEAVSANVDDFKGIEPENFCCIKFLPCDMQILEEPMNFKSGDEAVKSDYYNLKSKNGVPTGVGFTDFVFTPNDFKKKSKATATYREQLKEIDLVHNQIQKVVYELLVKKHGKGNVACEQSTGHGTKIDIAVKISDSYIFYELKTANTSKECIREALSQLLEYAYYPDNERASKLVIITPVDLSRASKSYLRKLRNLFNIPIFYQYFNLEQNRLGQEE